MALGIAQDCLYFTKGSKDEESLTTWESELHFFAPLYIEEKFTF